MKRLSEHLGAVLSGRYVLLDLVGQGGSGVVYLGRDLSLGRKVAVKLLHEGLSADASFIRRFHAEAKAAASLNHPSIVRVFDWGEAEGSPFLVFEFLSGGTLRRYLDDGHVLSISQAARVASEIAQALAYAHTRGYVHRDIKPSNLLFDEEGRIRIADFGIARALSEAAWTEPVGSVMGTARYASPEQALGGATNQAGDMYSFALVVVEAVTGKLPFASDTTVATLMARTTGDLEVPEELGPLRTLVEGFSKLDPSARLSASRVADELALLVRTLPVPESIDVRYFELSPTGGDPVTQVGPVSPATYAGPSANGSVVSNANILGAQPPKVPFDQDDLHHREREVPIPVDNTTVLRAPEPTALGAQDGGGLRADSVGAAPDEGALLAEPKSRLPAVMRSLVAKVVIAVVAVAIIAGGAFFVLQGTGTVIVPNLIGQSRSSAVSALGEAGAGLGKITYANDPSIPQGSVLSESPKPGASVSKHGAVSLVISLGPPEVAVPNVVGDQILGASYSISEAHLVPKVTEKYSETVPSGAIISQTPLVGKFAQGSVVTLSESKGPAPRVVPNLVGTTSSGASAQLAALGLSVTQTQQYSDTVAVGQVISQSVPSGSSVPRGSTIGIVVSEGPHMVTVPNLQYMTLAEAEAALQNIGLTVGSITGPQNYGVVLKQNPAAGSSLHYGLSVDLYVV